MELNFTTEEERNVICQASSLLGYIEGIITVVSRKIPDPIPDVDYSKYPLEIISQLILQSHNRLRTLQEVLKDKGV